MFYVYSKSDDIINDIVESSQSREPLKEDTLRELICFAQAHGFKGNILQIYITYFLLMDENPFTLSRERISCHDDSLKRMAIKDIGLLRFAFLRECMDGEEELYEYDGLAAQGRFDDTVTELFMEVRDQLAEALNAIDFMAILEGVYEMYGVGEIGYHKAFRIDDSGRVYPIRRIGNIRLNNLIGLTDQKEELIKNTTDFISGLPGNNCLLYGDAGTGKSSCIKAIANEYFKDGLRIVEVYKHQLKSLNDLVAYIKDRNYRFIIYMDDLSFEEFETDYKYLKALIEGGLEIKPRNVLIYATSNRRHLVRETFEDRNEDIHRNDTMQEKLSLFNRFGVTIYFGAPDKKEFEQILLGLKKQNKLMISDLELINRAHTWEIRHGGRSGRSAVQFIEYIKGEESKI